MINAKDDAYAVCSLTLANKLLIQMCLLACCAMSEFIQAIPLKLITLWKTTELKRLITLILHKMALTQPGSGASKTNLGSTTLGFF